MAFTITNTGKDTLISDGTQNPSFNRNFIAGLTKATAVENPQTGDLDTVQVVDTTKQAILMPYDDITDIGGSTPAALGLLDASQVATYLNNNFFNLGNGYLTSVSTAAPLTGDGTDGNPIAVSDGNETGDILIWNGTDWQIQPNPSWNLEARRNVKTFTFVGGFGVAPLPTTLLVGTPLYRNSTTIVTMLTPGIEGRDPVVQILNDAGNWIKLRTPQIAGSYFVVSDVSPKKYYYRQKIKVSSGGNSRHGFIDAPANTVLNGFGFETTGGNIKAFCNTGASYTYGASFAISSGTWYDCEIEYQYIGGIMVCKLFVDGILRSTANRVVGAFSFNASLQSMNTAGATSLIIHTDLIEYSIYG